MPEKPESMPEKPELWPINVTTITRVRNYCAEQVGIYNLENGREFHVKGNTGPPGSWEYKDIGQNIPWCVSPQDWDNNHRIQVVVGELATYNIWQANVDRDPHKGDLVRYSDDMRFEYHGTPVRPNPEVSGDRHLIIEADGKFKITKL